MSGRGGRGGYRGGEHRGGGGGRGGGDGGYRGGGYRGGGGGGRGRGGPQQMPMHGGPVQPETGGIYLSGISPGVPDPNVKALEDALVKVTRGKTFDGFPGRPGYGTMGKAIILRTNYFHLRTAYESNQLDMEKTLYRYNVDVIPATKDQEMSRPHRRRLMEQIVALEKFAGVTYATDFSRIIVTTTELDLDDGKRWEAKLTLSNGSASGKPPSNINLDPPGSNPPGFVQAARDRNSHRFALTYGGSFSVRHLIEYLKSTSAGAEYQSRVDIIQLLNIIMAKPPNENSHVVNVGQNTFYPCGIHPGTQSKSLGGGLDALRGYFCSVRPAIGRVLINMNATHGAFFKALPLIELLEDFNNRDLEQQETFIRMLKVKARYVKDGTKEPFMEKTKSVVGFAQTPRGGIQVKRFGNARDVKFRYTDRNNPGAAEREVSVYDYFRTHHGITLEHPQLPVLNVATRSDPQYLPQELCTVLPGQAYRRLLSGDQTTLMLHFAARYPNRNAISIAGDQSAPGHGVRMYRLRASQTDPDPQKLSVEPFGFNVNTDMISVPGRILAAPQISYKGKGVSPRLGSWNCANQAFSTPGGFTKWGALVLNCPGPRGRAMQDDGYGGTVLPEECFKELAKHLNDYGLKMGLRAPTQALQLSNLTRDNRDANDNTLEKAFAKASSDQIRMLFIVLPDVDRWLYARIKFFADTKYGFHTICAVGRKLQKSQGQGMFLGNLALKFNIKGGGVNHNVQNTLTKPLDNRNMLMGLDVTHPSPGSSDGAPSIACVVASVDQSLYQWPGSVRRQTPQREMMGDRRLMNRPNTINSLTEMVLERLELWRKKNKSLPTKVVVYRDGVSEGQYSLVLQHELPSFEEAFGKLYGARDRWPKMSIIVVGKRHHTRFYPTRQEDADYNAQRDKGSWNPVPGTVVDRGIAGKVLREFWLQAHQGLQGTARPAHYVVIKDDIGFEADELEQFTHKLCYLFNRATKAVSICPPAYYADLLAERCRAYMFTTMQEDHARGDGASEYSDRTAEWDGTIHPNLRESTWYI